MFTDRRNASPKESLNNKLLTAAHKGDLIKIKQLINKGADPNFVSHNEYMGITISTTPFKNLVYGSKGKFESYKPIIDYFIDELKININQPDFNGKTAAHTLACDSGIKTMRYLLTKGLDLQQPDHKNQYPIHCALSPTHNFAAVEFIAKNMTSIPIPIAERLLDLNLPKLKSWFRGKDDEIIYVEPKVKDLDFCEIVAKKVIDVNKLIEKLVVDLIKSNEQYEDFFSSDLKAKPSLELFLKDFRKMVQSIESQQKMRNEEQNRPWKFR